jgi:hypothetical protein
MRPEVTFLSVVLILVCVLCAILSFGLSKAFGDLANHEHRLERLEGPDDEFAARDAWDDEEAG